MTREEVITVLENEKKCFLKDSCDPCECDFCRMMVPEKVILSAYNMAIAAIREQEDRRWIPVTERLPEPKEKAICLNRHGETMIGTYTEWGWVFPGYYENPTHWMPLPEPPKEDA